jgi:uncharacterized linocin/CFP29 family protein
MNHLLRSHAPISDASWQLIDDEARERLEPALGARRLVDFSGPHGWDHSSTNLGRAKKLKGSPGEGVTALERVVLPLVELRADFKIARSELQDADRGAADPDLDPLAAAAHNVALAENRAVFHGLGGSQGIVTATPHPKRKLGATADYPDKFAAAVETLLASGVAGPFAVALGDKAYRLASGTADGGYPIIKHVEEVVDSFVWVSGLEGAVVLSRRGGDFLLDVGQDLSVGYDSHDATSVALYLEESVSFQVATPEAAVAFTA